MRIQLSNTLPNGKADVRSQQHQPGQPLHIQAVPGGLVSVEIDGQILTGKATIKGKRPALVRRDDDLLVLIDGEPVAIVDDYFLTPEAGLQGNDWVLSQAGGVTPAESAPAAETVAAETAGQSGNGLYWALGAAGLVGGIAAAAGGGGGGSGSGSGSASKSSAPVAQTTISGSVVAGPLLDGHGLSVTLHKADGSALSGPIAIDANGSFTAHYDRSYTGPVLAKVVDSTPGLDYIDEATGQGKSLNTELRAVFVSENQSDIAVVVTPMSELAARFMGLPPGESGTGKFTAADITQASQAVAKSLGLEGGLFQPVVTVVDASGVPVAKPNQAGLALMALSGLEHAHGTDAAMTLLSQAIAAADDKELIGLLISGSREASQLNQRDFVKLWTDTSPDSMLATTVHATQALTATQLKDWTPQHVATLGIDVLAALSPAQMAQLSAQAVSGITGAQLKLLDSGSLAGLMASHVLTDTQAQALSPQVLGWAMGLPSMALTIKAGAGVQARDIVQRDRQAAANDSSPTLSGKLAAKLPEGAELTLFNGQAKLGSAVIEADRQTWSFTPAEPWRDGVYAVDFRVQTLGVTASLASLPLQLTIDTADPVAPVLQLTQDLGRPGDFVTASGSFTVSGLEGGAQWQYSVDSGASWQDGAGTSFSVTQGSYAVNTIQVRQQDLAGNTSAAATNAQQIIVDSTAPTVQITSDQAVLRAGQTATLTFAFSEAVLNFKADNIVATHGVVSDIQAVAGRPNAYTARFTPTAETASAQVSVTLQGVQDVAGNALAGPGTAGLIALDTLAPSVEILASKNRFASGDTATIRFVFSEEPNPALQVQSVAVTNGSLSDLRQDPDDAKVYTATFTPAQNLAHGSVATITIDGASYSDASGNSGAQGQLVGLSIDNVAPTVSSVVIVGLDSAGMRKTTSLRAGDKVQVTLTMDEPMQISPEATYTIDINGSSRQARYLHGSGSPEMVFQYVIEPGDKDSSGGVTAAANALGLGGGIWTDMMGNPGPVAVPAVQAGGNAIQIDATALVMRQVTLTVLNADKSSKSRDAMAKIGDVLQFEASFHDKAMVNGQPQLAFSWAGRTLQAQYAGGSGSNKLLFDYVLAQGDQGPRDGIRVVQPALSFSAGASVQDAAGGAAILDRFQFTPLHGATDLVDVGQPMVKKIRLAGTVGAVDGWLTEDDTVKVEVTFDKQVTISGGVRVKLEIDDTVVYAEPSGSLGLFSNTHAFSYTVGAGLQSRSGIAIPDDALVLAGGSIQGDTGPANLASDGAGENSSYRVDSIHPEVTSVLFAGLDASGAVKGGSLAEGDTVRIEVRMSEAVKVTGRPYCEFTSGSGTEPTVSAFKASKLADAGGSSAAASVLVFEYKVKAGDVINADQLSGGAIGGSARIDDLRGNRGGMGNGWFSGGNGKVDASVLGDELFSISAEQILGMGKNGALWAKLGSNCPVSAIGMDSMQYGYWLNDGVAYHRQWTGEHNGKAVTLYVHGGQEELGYVDAARQGLDVTLQLDAKAVAGGGSRNGWHMEDGMVQDVSLVNDGAAVKLTLAEMPSGVIDLTYNGRFLHNAAYPEHKYSRLKIGSSAEETIDGSAYAGNQALFANGGGGQLTGGAGNDLLVAGAGKDVMTGGAGADIFLFGRNSGGDDVIRDFVKTQGDRIDLRQVLPASVPAESLGKYVQLAQAAGGGNDAVLSIDMEGKGSFANPGVVVTLSDGWTNGGLSSGLQDLVNQKVILV